MSFGDIASSVIARCNNFDDPIKRNAIPFFVTPDGCNSRQQVGFIRSDLVREILSNGRDIICEIDDGIEISNTLTSTEISNQLAELLASWREKDLFPGSLRGWRNELYPIYYNDDNNGTNTSKRKLAFVIERCAVGLFGLKRYGCHLNGYFVDNDGEYRMWIAKRSLRKQTWPGYFDNMVGGGLPVGLTPWENIIKEAKEEAGISRELCERSCKAAGCVSFFMNDEQRGLVAETEYVYDMRLDSDEFKPQAVDGEVEEFSLLKMSEILQLVAQQKFTPEAALVIVDFCIRHGILTAENTDGYLQVCNQLRSDLYQLP